MASNGREKHLYAMERAERSKFSQKMLKETALAINHATIVAIRKSSLKKVSIINFDPNKTPKVVSVPWDALVYGSIMAFYLNLEKLGKPERCVML